MGEVKEVPGVTEAELLADITKLCQPSQPIQPDEVTVNRMAAEWGRSTSTTQTILDRQVEAGTMSRRKALNHETGRECWAYRVCVRDVKDS